MPSTPNAVAFADLAGDASAGAVTRALLHTRQVEYRGFERSDGHWEMEAELKDVKTHSLGLYERGQVPAGEPIHHMVMRVVVDDDFVVRAIEARMLRQPLGECSQALPPMQGMLGASMRRGWRQSIDAALGQTRGCAHLRELLMNLATATWQTVPAGQVRREGVTHDKPELQDGNPPFQLDRCVTWNVNGAAVARHYPAYIGWQPIRRQGKDAEAPQP